MKAWSNKTRVRGTALFALHELRRTDRTGFEVSLGQLTVTPTDLTGPMPMVRMGQSAVMARKISIRDKMTMAALLAVEEIQRHSNAVYRLKPVGTKKEIAIVASYKMGPGPIIRDEEAKAFLKFGLSFKRGTKNNSTNSDEARTLHFCPADELDLLRA